MGCAGSKPADNSARTLDDIDANVPTPVEQLPPAPSKDVASSAPPQWFAELVAAPATNAAPEVAPVAAPAPAPVAVAAPAAPPTPEVDWKSVDWKEKLSTDEYKVLREQHTEAAGSGEYDRFYPPEGHFICRGCGQALFSAEAKFKSGCGWPSFDRCYEGAIVLRADTSHGERRRELVCARCEGHLGHLFSGEKLTEADQRHCVNSLSIKFVKAPPTTAAVDATVDTSAVDRELDKAAGPGSNAGMASVVPASDLDMSDAGLAADWAATRSRPNGWCVCSYAPDSKVRLVPVARGEQGFDELREQLCSRPDVVSYAVVAASVDGRQRFAFLCYIGENTSALRRGRAAMHSQHVEKFYDGTVGAFPAITSSSELETAHVNKLLMQLCKGAKEAVVR